MIKAEKVILFVNTKLLDTFEPDCEVYINEKLSVAGESKNIGKILKSRVEGLENAIWTTYTFDGHDVSYNVADCSGSTDEDFICRVKKNQIIKSYKGETHGKKN